MVYKELLKLARQTLESNFQNRTLKIPEQIKTKFSKKQACFVTLTKNNQLRGCIGSLEPHQPLYQDIINNTLNAAFSDYRFLQLTQDELKKIKIEISILTMPKKLKFKNPKDLLNKINKNMGIVLNYGGHSATFLPQVWEQIPDKIRFLEHLSLKAGLDKDAWKNSEIKWYGVEKIKED